MKRARGAARGVVHLIGLGMALGGLVAVAAPGETTRVSVSSAGDEAESSSAHAAMSADGRYVAFVSRAANLVAGDTNETTDVFLHDRQTGETIRVSVSTSGEQGSRESTRPTISADGRYVVFESYAPQLVVGDTNGMPDIFVYDRQDRRTSRVSIDSQGREGRSGSLFPSVSADGRYVVFSSWSTSLVPNDTNNLYDVFVHDRSTGTTTRSSVNSSGVEGNGNSGYVVSVPGGVRSPSISADGRFVVFSSDADNLVAGDTNTATDVFIHDRQTGETTRASVGTGTVQGNGASINAVISADGRYVVFESVASNLVAGDTNDARDVFLHDRNTGETTRVSVSAGGAEGNGESAGATISPEGQFVAFYSNASNLVWTDTNDTGDAYLYDRQTHTIRLVSLSSTAVQGNSASLPPVVVGTEGRFVVFESYASNLVAGDTNGAVDVFVHEPAGFGEAPVFGVTEIPSPVMADCSAGYWSGAIAWGLNDNAQAVGYTSCYVASGQPEWPYVQQSRGFRWSEAAGSSQLPLPPSFNAESYPRYINEAGVALGEDAALEGYILWSSGGGVSEFTDPEQCFSFPRVFAGGIDDSGTVAFMTYRKNAAGECRRTAALRRANGELITDPNYFRSFALNNSELAAGSVNYPNVGIGAAKWSPTGGLVVLDAPETGRNKYAQDVNEKGDVVGLAATYSTDSSGCLYSASDAVLWRADGGTSVLPKLGNRTIAAAAGINDQGDVVGSSEDPTMCADPSEGRATLWKDGQAWDLNALIPQDLNIRLLDAREINAAGQILARGIRLDEPKKSCPALVYDPATGSQKWDDTIMCQPTHSYLLAPAVASTYSITPQSVTKKESDGTVTFTVSRTPATAAETVYVSTVQTDGFLNDGDYVGLEDVALAFAAGESSKTVTIQLLDDQKAGEPDETFGLIVQKTPGPVTEFVASATFTIQDSNVSAVPFTPTNPTPGTAGSPGPALPGTSVTLSWGASSGATYYSVAVRDMVNNVLVVNTTTASTSYPASLIAGGQYRWNVAACNATDCSSFTTALYFQMEAVGPPPGEPVRSVAPSPDLPFQPTVVETSNDALFTITNIGEGTLTGTCTVGAPFSLPNGCSYSLSSKDSTSITVRFTPSDPQPYAAPIAFKDNGTAGSVTLRAVGSGTAQAVVDTDGDGVSDEWEIRIAAFGCPRSWLFADDPNLDCDNDALPDLWETTGNIRLSDGTVAGFLDLPGKGADPLRKDVFVLVEWFEDKKNEIDDCYDYYVVESSREPGCNAIDRDVKESHLVCSYNHSHKPSDAAIKLVKEAFWENGIRLHVDYGGAIEEDSVNRPAPFCRWPWCTKARLWSTVLDVQSRNGSAHFPETYRRVYHYSLFMHDSTWYHAYGVSNSIDPATGAFVGGTEFVVTAGAAFDKERVNNVMAGHWDRPVVGPNDQTIAYTFMHELGHNLTLRHGANNDTNFKPNHISVMNYAFAFEGLTRCRTALPYMSAVFGPSTGDFCWPGALDYSHFGDGEISPLNEVEGIGELLPILKSSTDPAGDFVTKYFCEIDGNDVRRSGRIDMAVDWNCDSTIGRAEDADVNGDGCFTRLTSVDEWKKMQFQVGAIGPNGREADLTAPAADTIDEIDEPGHEEWLRSPVVSRVAGDLDNDEEVDFDDLSIILADLGMAAHASKCGAICDVNADGLISEADAASVEQICSYPDCSSADVLGLTVDIKPGGSPNIINSNARGVVPVAIITTSRYDAAEIDPASVRLEGVLATNKGKSGKVGAYEDVDGDGDLDLVLHFPTQALGLTRDSKVATIKGMTYGGTRVMGADSVSIVP